MNKSTPINQLPISNGQNGFVNDQQRQMVMQAQNAINNLPMPQNTQQSPDIASEDDATIQDVLNQINGGAGNNDVVENGPMGMNMNVVHSMQPPQMQHQPMPPQAIPPQMMPPQMMQHPPQPAFENYMGFMGQFPPQPQPFTPSPPPKVESESDGSFLSFMSNIAEDVKLAAFVFVLFIAVNFIPAEKFLSRYFAIDKIPYYDIIVKALIAFIAVILLKKLIVR